MNSREIRVLGDNLVDRIAAGEVVERPASVIKELLENALDAGAAAITVEIEGGPVGLLRVADDGDGIPGNQLRLALQRHATSKIAVPEDLEHIQSLGFRGEGLAAISAVSRTRIQTRNTEETEGAEIEGEGGKYGTPRPAGRARGTTVEVRDLFFNTPARRKFMKSDSAELRHISQLIQAYALARPDVHFTYNVEGRASLDLPQAPDLHTRAGQVLGRERLSRMVPVLVDSGDLKLEGFVGAPENSRVRSGHQIFLINGRWVSSVLLRTAVREAYSDLIPPSRHPEALLHLEISPEEIDVNVHPTKREVRLLRERMLYPRLISALRDLVEGRFPSLRLKNPGTPSGEPGSEFQVPLGLYLSRPAPANPDRVADAARKGPVGEVLSFPGPGRRPPGDAGAFRGIPEKEEEPPAESPAMASMWQVHETYILASVKDGVLVIDQHAAHERVLYEQVIGRFRGAPAASQELLFPLLVHLTHDEFAVLLEAMTSLEKLGFHLEKFGETDVLVHAIPGGLREWRHGALLKDVIDHFTDLPTSIDVQERVARSVACQGAIKAGQKLSLEEMNVLVDQLFATEKPQGDPHGRPVFLRMGLDELHRRFGRS